MTTNKSSDPSDRRLVRSWVVGALISGAAIFGMQAWARAEDSSGSGDDYDPGTVVSIDGTDQVVSIDQCLLTDQDPAQPVQPDPGGPQDPAPPAQ